MPTKHPDFHRRMMALADGGHVRGPGSGTSDSIPARLSDGEFVLPADTVRKVGVKSLRDLVNVTHQPSGRPTHPAHFADGGVVDLTNRYSRSRSGFDMQGWAQQQMQEQSQRTQEAMAAGQAAQQQAETAAAKPQSPSASQQNGYAPGTRGAELLAAEQQKAQNRAATGAAIVDAIKAPFAKGNSTVAPSLNDPVSPSPVAQNPTDQRLASGAQATPAAPAATATSETSNPAAPLGQNTGPGTGPDTATGRPVGFAPGVYEHGRGKYSDNPTGMGFARGFTGQPSAQNEAAWQRLADRSQVESTARVAAGLQAAQPAQPAGFQAPTVRHSGNDWQARNDLRNAEVSAGSIMNTRKWGGPGAENNPDVLKYKAMLANDMAMRGLQPAADVAAMRENASLQREGMQQAGANDRATLSAMSDAERNQISRNRLALEQTTAGFQNRTAQRMENAQVALENAKTPEQQRSARERLLALAGKEPQNEWGLQVTPTTKNLDGSTTQGSVWRYNKMTGETALVDGKSSAVADVPSSKDALVKGQVYQTARGPARWDGGQFQPVR